MNNICIVDRCERTAVTRGLCSPHYRRWWRHGDPLGGGTGSGEALRYYRDVVLVYEGEECLIWPFACGANGYAHLYDGKKLTHVHRRVCEKLHGPAPTPKHEAAHSCGRGHHGCVSGHHLSWKTRAENEADKVGHGTSTRGERQNHAKLTEAEIHQIRGLGPLQSGREIARQFGVCPSTVSEILSGKSWAWL